MNWRNPFLTGYLAVTVVGTGILGYLLYSGYSHYSEVSENYDSQVARLQQLQNKVPFPNAENNKVYKELTSQYRAEYDKLLAQVSKMQKPLESITPQAFQDRLRAYVSEVTAAAKENNVRLSEDFYLGFDSYRDTLPPNEAASVLARELDAIRLVMDRLIESKVREILGIKRELLPEEGGAALKEESTSAPGGHIRTPANTPKITTANSFDIAFVADQNRTRQSINAIATAKQFFFVIRNLTIQNSAMEGPKQHEDAPLEPPPQPADPQAGATTGAQPQSTPAGPVMRLLVGRETLTVAAHIEMITFTPPAPQK